MSSEERLESPAGQPPAVRRRIKRLLIGLAALAAALGSFWLWRAGEARRQSHEAQMKLGEGSYELGAAVKRLRAHMGYRLTERQAEEQIREVFRAGKFMDAQKAASFRIRGETAFRNLGEEMELEMTLRSAKMLNTFGALDGCEYFMEIAERAGVKTPDELDVLGGQVLIAGYRTSHEDDPVEYLRGLAQAQRKFQTVGASLVEVIAIQSRARAVAASREGTEELMETILVTMENPKAQAIVAKYAGLSRRKWLAQPFMRRFEQVGECLLAEAELDP